MSELSPFQTDSSNDRSGLEPELGGALRQRSPPGMTTPGLS